MAALSLSHTEYIFNHVFLPPQLPQHADDRSLEEAANDELLRLVNDAIRDYRENVSQINITAISKVIVRLLGALRTVESEKEKPQRAILECLKSVGEKGVLALRIRCQNAAVIFRRSTETTTVECFELLPSNQQILGTNLSLRRNFPAHAVELSNTIFDNTHFQKALTKSLHQLDTQTVREMSASTNSSMKEDRSSAHDQNKPDLVVVLLMTILVAKGKPVSVNKIQKRYRDDVQSSNESAPWRRSGLWLLIKISLQTTFVQFFGYGNGTTLYKNFMILFLTSFLRKSPQLANDLQHVARAKIARRVYKLRNVFPDVRCAAETTVADSKAIHDTTWADTIKEDSERKAMLPVTSVERDICMNLPDCLKLVDLLKNRHHVHSQVDDPSKFKYRNFVKFRDDGLPVLSKDVAEGDEAVDALTEVEEWVLTDIDAWASRNDSKHDIKQLVALRDLAIRYREWATPIYQGNPELNSTMIITFAALWWALDRLACSVIPLLKEYSPEISSSLFKPLMLPRREQMGLLAQIDSHLAIRMYDASRFGRPSIFLNPIDTVDHFSTRYFDTDPTKEHSNLRRRILRKAQQMKERRLVEWQELTDLHRRLVAEVEDLECISLDSNDRISGTANRVGKRHLKECDYCRLKREAELLAIEPFEWPLPKEETPYKAIIFELQCPAVYSTWRDVTWELLGNMCLGSQVEEAVPSVQLQDYEPLKRYSTGVQPSLVLASTTAPLSKARAKSFNFPVDEENIFCDNGLSLQLFDHSRNLWVKRVRSHNTRPSLVQYCLSDLPGGDYTTLQPFVNDTNHSQNEVLASQSKCPVSLRLPEYLTFGSLRADSEWLQWCNIVRMLSGCALTFNNHEVYLLITKAAWQVGSTNMTLARKPHTVLTYVPFCREVLANLKTAMMPTLSNWKNEYIMQITIVILQRILSLNADHAIIQECHLLLGICRNNAREWMRTLAGKMEQSRDSYKLISLRLKLLKAIFLCRMTFDGESDAIINHLESSADFAIWNLSSILLRQNLSSNNATMEVDLKGLQIRDRKLTWRIWRLAITNINDIVISRAINAATSLVGMTGEDCSTAWSPQEGQAEHDIRWFQVQINSDLTQIPIIATFNILDGHLNVAGKSLGRLPLTYAQSEAYRKFFDERVIPVMASDCFDMEFMSTQTLDGFRVHFGHNGEYHTIRLSNANERLDFLPQGIFVEHVPATFVKDYVHLYDHETGNIEFRPVSNWWQKSRQSWFLEFKPSHEAILRNEDCYLIDVHSQTFRDILQIFDRFEKWDYIHVTTSSVSQLQVVLPRLGLHFSLNASGQLENHELRMIIDQDQSLGTLIGLKSRLVLCNPDMASPDTGKSLCRKVIIPVGKITIARNERFQHVHILVENEDRSVEYCSFDVDSIVGRLRGDGTIANELYQIYLHATTSSLLKDPLTGRSGTNEALALLRRQSNSIMFPISDIEHAVLCQINALAPERLFTAKSNATVYHTIWDKNVCPLVCRQEFADWAEKIVTKSNMLEALSANGSGIKTLKSRGEAHLSRRAVKLNSVFRPQEFRHSLVDPADDSICVSRDTVKNPSRVRNVHEIVLHITEWNERQMYTQDLGQELRGLGKITGFEKTMKFDEPLSDVLRLPLSNYWGALWKLCCGSDRNHADKLSFLFATIAYRHDFDNLQSLKSLLAFAMIPTLRTLPNPPTHTSYDFAAGVTVDDEALRIILKATARKFKYSQSHLPEEERLRERAPYNEQLPREVQRALQHYSREWPIEVPREADSADFSWLRIKKAHPEICALFTKWHKNGELQRYVDAVQHVLDQYRRPDEESACTWSGDWPRAEIAPRMFNVHNLPCVTEIMRWGAPRVLPQRPEYRESLPSRPRQPKQDLRKVIEDITTDCQSRGLRDKDFPKRYRNSLLQSLDHLEKSFAHPDHELSEELLTPNILANYDECWASHRLCAQRLKATFRPLTRNLKYPLLDLSGLWPIPSLYEMLTYLAPKYQSELPHDWKTSLEALGTSVTSVQRARRLLLALYAHDRAELIKELENYSTATSMVSYPQWLATEIEGDFRARESQVRVAIEMIEPSSGKNNLLQVGMGEGKSSVITPLMLAASADGRTLVRMSSPKALVPQLHSLIAQRNCGINDQPLFFIPFGRDMPLNEEILRNLRVLLQQCIRNHGILVILPEHILSLKLLLREKQIDGPLEYVKPLQDISDGFHHQNKDFLDESDEILDPRSQLIYMVGHPKTLDGMPERGLVVQEILHRVGRHALRLCIQDPQGIRAFRRTAAAFPFIEVRSAVAGAKLVKDLVSSIGQSSLSFLNLDTCSAVRIAAILSFISDVDVTEQTCVEVENSTSEQPALWKHLLVLRGLVAHNILMHALTEKRWFIDYGLHPTRCLSAVPYRAHQLPALSAEFAQPEVHLVLTCLSYYYHGVSPDQLKQAFGILTKRPDPSHDFGLWIRHCDSLPSSLRDYRSVNLADEEAFMEHLYPALQYSRALADFFLLHVVFPKEAKEFSEKLSSSGWDIALTSESPYLTTGFSGTSDNSSLLPFNIMHRNIRELESTSAKVLDLVLQPKNSHYTRLRSSGHGFDAVKTTIASITCADPKIRMIIDIGAQLIGLANAEIIKVWLEHAHQAEAGMFLDPDGNLMVMDRCSKIELLSRYNHRFFARSDRFSSSPSLGVDIKMPKDTRAAVVLGPRLTKDRLVQGCLRLRGLAQNQSLMFFAPPSIDTEIRELRGKNANEEVGGCDVISWTLHQTCLQHDRYVPLHILQGLTYYSQQDAARRCPHNAEVERMTRINSPLVENETQDLHDLYAPSHMKTEAESFLISTCRQMQDPHVQRLLSDWDSLKIGSPLDAVMHEEHQREVMQEVEQQVHVERPGLMVPAKPKINKHLKKYVEEGTKSMLTKFGSVHETVVLKSSAGKELLGPCIIWPHLKVSSGFEDVVLQWDYGHNNSIIRPANWILVNSDPAIEADLLLISQHEAGQVFDIATAVDAKVRLFSYEPRVSRGSPTRDPQAIVLSNEIVDEWSSLVPSHVSRELQSFAGQLYLPSYEEYLAFRSEMSGHLRFYKEWLEIRCRGEDFTHTHMGRIVEGRILQESDFIDNEENGGHIAASAGLGTQNFDVWDDDVMMNNGEGDGDHGHIEDDDSDNVDEPVDKFDNSTRQPIVTEEDDDDDEINTEHPKKEEDEDCDSKDWLKYEEDEDKKDWKEEDEQKLMKVEDLDAEHTSEVCKLEADDSSSFHGFGSSSSNIKREDKDQFVPSKIETRAQKKRRLA